MGFLNIALGKFETFPKKQNSKFNIWNFFFFLGLSQFSAEFFFQRQHLPMEPKVIIYSVQSVEPLLSSFGLGKCCLWGKN